MTAFSSARESLRPEFAPDILLHEMRQACGSLGVAQEHIQIHDFPVRHLPQRRQEILEILVSIRNEFKPDLVFVHASTDVHQDHHTVSSEATRAFKQTTVLGYELPWNTLEFHADAIIALSKEDMEAKMAALAFYKSQDHRTYANQGVIQGLARVRGASISAEFGEAFEVIRWVMR